MNHSLSLDNVNLLATLGPNRSYARLEICIKYPSDTSGAIPGTISVGYDHIVILEQKANT